MNMSLFLVVILLLYISYAGSSGIIHSLINQPIAPNEYTALYEFYNATDGPNWEWASNASAWNFDNPNINPCTAGWTGIQCSCPIKSTYCHVTGIALGEHKLRGSLISSISQFVDLTSLDLRRNRIFFEIPSSLGTLSKLENLFLTDNWFSSTIPPSLGNCLALTDLAVSRNVMVGEIPVSIYKLPNLRQFEGTNNQFNGTLPHAFVTMRNIAIFDLTNNRLTGTIPEHINLLNKTLITLDLGYNKLTGTIPASIGALHKLNRLAIGGNDFHSSIPESIYNLHNLSVFSLEYNRLNGTISPAIGNLRNLTLCVLNFNNLTGSIPENITNLTHMTYLTLSINSLTGSIPQSIGRLTELRGLQLYNNSLTSSIPDGLGQLRHLQLLYLQVNLLTGSFPRELHWEKLYALDCTVNTITGELPTSFYQNSQSLRWLYLHNNAFSGNLTGFTTATGISLLYMDIRFNFFTGPLPVGALTSEGNYTWSTLYNYLTNTNFFIGTLPAVMNQSTVLKIFNITDNIIYGSIPAYFTYNENLNQFLVGHNILSGPFPSFPIVLANLELLHVENNFLISSIPNSIINCPLLAEFEAQYNQLTGTLPSALFNSLPALERIFLQSNVLAGTIPKVIRPRINFAFSNYTTISNLDLSDNQLTGTIPESLFLLESLRSFAAVSNCLSGSLSSGICAAGNLTGLALDGISTGSNCRQPIFALLSNQRSNYLNGYFLKLHLAGTIPACLFDMPYLKSLHLSGNGLTGSLPQDLQISDALIDLSLSYNQLTGSIPEVIQTNIWETLDLSHNKLTGELVSGGFQNMSKTPESALFLEVNRLSGEIPSELVSVKNISILRGNMFSCLVDRTDLPFHDSEADTYSCGSDVTNTSLLVWLGCSVIPLLIVAVAVYSRSMEDKTKVDDIVAVEDFVEHPGQESRISTMVNIPEERHTVVSSSQSFQSIIHPHNNSFMVNREEKQRVVSGLPNTFSIASSSVNSLIIDVKEWRQTMVYIDADERKESTRYGRTNPIHFFAYFVQIIRKIFLILTAILLFVFIPLYATISQFVKTYSNEFVWSVSAMLLSGVIAGSILCFAFTAYIIWTWRLFEGYLITSFRKWKETRQLESETYNGWKMFGVTCLFLVNFVMLILIDVIYVVIYVNGNNTAIFFAQFCIAIFKLFWNEVFLWNWMKRIHVFANIESLLPKESQARNTDNNRDSQVARMTLVHRITNAMQYMEASNYIPSSKDIILFIIINAFNNIIIPFVAIAVVDPNCYYNAIVAASTVNTTYSYNNCAIYLGLIARHNCVQYDETVQGISYSPPFVYSYQCSSYLVINYIPVHIISYVIIGILLPMVKISVKFIHTQVTMHLPNMKSLARVLERLVPMYLRELQPMPRQNQPPLFRKHRLVVQINNAIMILVTFGLLFPPLALIIYLSVMTITLFDEFMIGKLLTDAKKKGYQWYRTQIEFELDNIAEGFQTTIWISLYLSSFMCAYIIFDILGDSEGWETGIGPAIGLCCVPVIINVLHTVSTTAVDSLSAEERDKSFFEMLPHSMMQYLARDSSIGLGRFTNDQLPENDTANSGIEMEYTVNPISASSSVIPRK